MAKHPCKSGVHCLNFMNTPASSPSRTATSSVILPLILLAVGLLATVAVYAPGLSGPFLFEDIFQIQNNSHLRLGELNASSLQLAAFSTDGDPSQRPVSLLSFALNFYFFGEGSASFKIVNLGIHLINGILIFLLARRLFRLAAQRSDINRSRNRTTLAAALIATLWLVHPINLSSVLYVVQRTTLLSALFVLLALLTYTTGRLKFPNHRFQGALWFAATALFWLGGLASKENALLWPWYILLIEGLFFYPLQSHPTRSTRLYTLTWLIIPLISGLIYFTTHSGLLDYSNRSFTMIERLLTETRVLWFYVGLILLPRPGALGIFHDDFTLSTSLFDPWTTLPAILGGLLVVGFAIRFHRRQPLLAFGILFFLAAHALESTILPLQIMQEHRNYLAGFGVLFGIISLLVFTPAQREIPPNSPSAKGGTEQALQRYLPSRIRFVLTGVFFLFLGAITLGRAAQWQNPDRLILSQVHHHPESATLNYEAGRLFVNLREQTQDWLQKDQFNAQAVQYFAKAATLAPQEATAPLAILLANAGNANPTDPAMIQEALDRLLHHSPVDAAIDNLLTLSRCERQRNCSLPNGLVDRLFQALLANPQTSSELRATLFDELALRAMGNGRLIDAEALFKQALAIDATQGMFRINYVLLLLQLGRLDEAREHLDRILAIPQSARIMQLAETVKQHIEQSAMQNAPKPEIAPASASNFLFQELAQPKEQLPLFNLNRNPDQANQ